jgi:Regulator of chromosome condensation (RCC1) repeat
MLSKESLTICERMSVGTLWLASAVAVSWLVGCGSPSSGGADARGGSTGGAGETIDGAAGAGAGAGGADGGVTSDAGLGDGVGPNDAKVIGLGDVKRGRLACGNDFTCALDGAGKVVCWGTVAAGAAPLEGGYTYVAAGYSHACAIGASGEIKCWNARGSGNDDVELDVPTGAFRQIAVGGDTTGDYACALDMAGAVRCWRSHTVAPRAVLTTPPAGAHLAAIDLSAGHACGLEAANGRAVCWGEPGLADLAAPPSSFVDVGVGDAYSCGIANDGTLACWGTAPAATTFPTAFHGLAVAASTSGIVRLTCVLLDVGRVWCDAGGGAFPGAPDKSALFDELSVGVNHVCAVTRDDKVECWSEHASSAVTEPPAGLTLLRH